MNKTKEYIQKWHQDIWEKLDDHTKELLDQDDVDLRRKQSEYAQWHEASLSSPACREFYGNSTSEEKIEAQQRLSEADLCKNPYTLMQRLNVHILYARYGEVVGKDLGDLSDELCDDVNSSDSEIQQHIAILRDSAQEFRNQQENIVLQLTAEADDLEQEAEAALEVIEQLMKQ